MKIHHLEAISVCLTAHFVLTSDRDGGFGRARNDTLRESVVETLLSITCGRMGIAKNDTPSKL